MKIQHTPFPQGTVWQPEDPYLPVNLLWKMTKCNKDLAEVGLWAVHNRGGVTVIRISLWLTRWARRSLKSQGSRLRRPPSNTSQGQLLFIIRHAHFSSPLSPLPSLSPSAPSPRLSFWDISKRWKMACSWPSTSFLLSGSAVHCADRDPRTSISECAAALTQVALLHRWMHITPTCVRISYHYIPPSLH